MSTLLDQITADPIYAQFVRLIAAADTKNGGFFANMLGNPAIDVQLFAPTNDAFLGFAHALGFTGSDPKLAADFLISVANVVSREDPIAFLDEFLLHHISAVPVPAGGPLPGLYPTLAGPEVAFLGSHMQGGDPSLPAAPVFSIDSGPSNGTLITLSGVMLPETLVPPVGPDGAQLTQGTSSSDAMALGNGDDYMDAGNGSDSIKSGSGNDLILGGTGNDTLRGGDGDDYLSGNTGHDHVRGDNGQDTLLGGRGSDKIDGGAGDDLLLGEADADKLYGRSGNDTLDGGAGNDRLTGGEGHDELRGGIGDDLAFGEADNDAIYGQDGNDDLRGGEGHDRLFGGSGRDRLDGGAGNDRLFGNGDHDLIYGGSGEDTLKGHWGADRLYGGDGSDLLLGGGGHDAMHGGDGADTLKGGLGRDTMTGGEGSDRFVLDPDHRRDHITDFEHGVDTLDVTELGAMSLDDVILTQIANDVAISFSTADGAGVEILVLDTLATTFTGDDFQFL